VPPSQADLVEKGAERIPPAVEEREIPRGQI
jgi:hypothetical protein